MKSVRSKAGLAAACLISLMFAVPGCGKNDSKAQSDKSAKSADAKGGTGSSAHSIIGVTLSPDVSRPLKAGSTVKLSVEVDYMLPSQGGSIGVVVQDVGDKPVASALKEVGGGVGKFTTELEFKIAPASKSVRVSVPLYVKGETKSSEIVNKDYAVEP